MLSKNFKELDDYEIFQNENFQNELMQKIEVIESQIIEDKDINSIGSKARYIAEDILLEGFNCEGIGLWERMQNLRKTNMYIPTNVHQQLNILKIFGNDVNHPPAKKSDKAYKIIFSKEDAIIVLRAIHIILIFIINQNKNNIKISTFDKSFYEKYLNIADIKNKDLNNTNDDISSNLMSISQLVMLKEYKFNIPTYQRDYTWNIKNISKLLDDMLNRSHDNKTHYLGALAIASNEENKILRIIDGQQRITTTLIILKAFHDVYTDNNLKEQTELKSFIKNINKIYINQKVLTSQQAVARVLSNNLITSEASLKNSAAFKNYFFVKSWLTDHISNIDEIYMTFVSKFEIVALLFKTTVDNEMDIFENLNTGGTQLNSWELIKNYIFSRLNPTIFREKELDANLYINRKFAIPLNLSRESEIKVKLANFFTQYVRMENISKNKSILKKRDIYESFKELWPRKSKYETYQSFITDLNKIVKRFNIYMEFTKWYKNNDSPLHIYSHILNFIVKDDIAPLLMRSLEKTCEFDDEFKIKKVIGFKFYRLIKSIEKYFIRVMVVSGFGNSQSDNFDHFLLLNWQNLDGEKYDLFSKTVMKPSIPSKEEFKDFLSTSGTIKKGAIINILINLEHKLRGINIKNTSQYPFEKTHEHIIAKKLPVEEYDGEIDADSYNDLQTRWMDSLGNSLILSRGDNSKAGNKSFAKKLPIYKDSSYLAKGSENIMNLVTKKVFTFEDVKERSEQIAEFVSKEIYK